MRKFWIVPLAGAVLFAFTSSPVWAQGDAAAGEKVFKKCQACHSLEAGQHKTGPSLHNVIGRQAGSTDFKRYKGLVGADFTWDEAKLDEYLIDPSAFVKTHTANSRSGMAFKLKDPQDRADVIAYLKSLQ
ncbi:MAG: c-type cytochrome [Hyphomicrobiales bacterium]|nr:c-type cytochrome [Hyphomicrobiales bacterium]